MAYIDGFVAAVPTANRDAYLDHARAAAAVFMEHGATRCVECWGDDVKDGKVTDFRRAVQAKDDETVVFAWIEHPDSASRDAAMAAVMEDPRMKDMAMPFDGQRMIFGGFDLFHDERPGDGHGYVDGFLVPVPTARKADYLKTAQNFFPVVADHGIHRHAEAWGDDVPEGKVTDMARAVQASPDESVVFSWFEWPDRAARDAGAAAMMADPRMAEMPADLPFDGKRMIYGGFEVIMDERK